MPGIAAKDRAVTRLSRRCLLATIGLIGGTALPGRRAAAEEPAAPAKPVFVVLGDFTTNLPDEDDQLSYVVIGITLEVTSSSASDLKALEPLLKEAIVRRLLTLADRHVLRPARTDPEVVKTALLDAITKLSPDGIRDVLITRLLYG